jgi:hypothetical protein
MKFSSREDIDAPIEQVFAHLSDFAVFEAMATKRGAQVERVKDTGAAGLGTAWDAEFKARGRLRSLSLEVVEFDRPNGMRIESTSEGIESDFSIELMSLSRTRTRMNVSLELRPKTLPARLLIQSLKLAKATLTKRFKLRVADYAKTLEDDLRKTA